MLTPTHTLTHTLLPKQHDLATQEYLVRQNERVSLMRENLTKSNPLTMKCLVQCDAPKCSKLSQILTCPNETTHQLLRGVAHRILNLLSNSDLLTFQKVLLKRSKYVYPRSTNGQLDHYRKSQTIYHQLFKIRID